jgi:hypothetical protein
MVPNQYHASIRPGGACLWWPWQTVTRKVDYRLKEFNGHSRFSSIRLGEDFVNDRSVAVKDESSALAVNPDPKV